MPVRHREFRGRRKPLKRMVDATGLRPQDSALIASCAYRAGNSEYTRLNPSFESYQISRPPASIDRGRRSEVTEPNAGLVIVVFKLLNYG
jgi:hypothetical protein